MIWLISSNDFNKCRALESVAALTITSLIILLLSFPFALNPPQKFDHKGAKETNKENLIITSSSWLLLWLSIWPKSTVETICWCADTSWWLWADTSWLCADTRCSCAELSWLSAWSCDGVSWLSADCVPLDWRMIGQLFWLICLRRAVRYRVSNPQPPHLCAFLA